MLSQYWLDVAPCNFSRPHRGRWPLKAVMFQKFCIFETKESGPLGACAGHAPYIRQKYAFHNRMMLDYNTLTLCCQEVTWKRVCRQCYSTNNRLKQLNDYSQNNTATTWQHLLNMTQFQDAITSCHDVLGDSITVIFRFGQNHRRGSHSCLTGSSDVPHSPQYWMVYLQLSSFKM